MALLITLNTLPPNMNNNFRSSHRLTIKNRTDVMFVIILMKLLTHNFLVCNKKTCANTGVKNYPLELVVSKWADYDDESAMECSKGLIKTLVAKLDWPAFRQTILSVSLLILTRDCSLTGVSPACPKTSKSRCLKMRQLLNRCI